MEERLITDWLLISNIIKNNRIINDLPYSEVIIISILKRNKGEMSFKDLVTTSKILKSQLTRTIKSLEEKRLIKKITSENDKRLKTIYLTKQGSEAYDSFHIKSLELSKEIIDILGSQDTEILINIFEKVINNQTKLK